MVDAESILDLIPSKQKQRIPKLGDTNEANRFNSCPDYKRVSYSKKTGKTGVLKDMWVRAPQRRKLPMAKLVDALVIKTETRIWFGSSVVEQVWLTPDFVTDWVRFPSGPQHQIFSDDIWLIKNIGRVCNLRPTR